MSLRHEVHGLLWRVRNRASHYRSCTEFQDALKAPRVRATGSFPPATVGSRQATWLPLAAVAAVVLTLAALARAQITASQTPANPSPPPPVSRLTPGEVKINPNDGQRYVWIAPGTFRMGCSPGDNQCDDNEKPPHTVTITRSFWMAQTEVTVGAYRRFAQATGKSMPPAPGFRQDESHPVVNVTWDDAVAYCRWAGGRLPTEAEWEYAARAGTTGPYYGDLNAIAWYFGNSGYQTHPVGQKGPNAFRLYDMLGNVWEWVADWYGEKYYAGSEARDPEGPPGGTTRGLRGGSWLNYLRNLRASYRVRYEPGNRYDLLGFRCVREVIP
jgi:sulfatase modifying factor 1